jgi:hypothetical protein
MSVTISGDGTITGLDADGISSQPVFPGNVLQVVSTTKTDTFSASLARGAISGDAITASITPTSSSSKILVLFNGSFGNSNTAPIYILLYKGGSVVSGATGNAAGNRLRSSAASFVTATTNMANINLNYLDSPATTSSTTYSIRIGHGSGETRTLYLNRSDSDGDFDYLTRTASFLTLVEIAA